MVLNSPIVFFGSAAVLALLAGTLRAWKRNLLRRSSATSHLIGIRFADFLETILWIAAIILLLCGIPHPIAILLTVLLLVSVATLGKLRYLEERDSLNRWSQLATEMGIPLTHLLDSFGNGTRSPLTRRIKACTRRMVRGENAIQAVYRSKLPLDPGVFVEGPSLRGEPASASEQPDSWSLQTQGDQTLSEASLLRQQTTYLLVTVALAWAVGYLTRMTMLPLVEDLLGELSYSNPLSNGPLESVAFAADVLMVLLIVWLMAGLIIRLLPSALVFAVPWFGRSAIDRWRAEILNVLAGGQRAHQSDQDILNNAAQMIRVRWVRSRCRSAAQKIDGGATLPIALRAAGIVTAKEMIWLNSAHANQTLPLAVAQLSTDIRRRSMLRWRLRMTWLLPMVTVIVGGFVLIHAVFLFRFLSLLMGGLS